MWCVTEGEWTSAKETEGCFERITTNSWRQKNDRRNPRLLLFPRVELFLKFRNDDRATKSDEEISLLFFFSSIENRVENFGNEFRFRNRNSSKRVEFFSSGRKRCIIRVIAQLLRNCWPSRADRHLSLVNRSATRRKVVVVEKED